MLRHLTIFYIFLSSFIGAWNYDYGGKNWEHLCSLGKNQSPININKIEQKHYNHPKFYFNNHLVKFYNTGVYLKYSPLVKNSLGYFVFQNEKYSVQQYHYHSVSEHSLQDKLYPLELHIVGKNKKNQLSVISVLFKIGKDNSFLKKMGWNQKIKNLPMPLCRDNKIIRPCKKDDLINNFIVNNKEEITVDLRYLNRLFENRKFYHYLGSLTTPPCTENINWLILSKPEEVTETQLSYYTYLLNNDRLLNKNHFHNNRKIQKNNGRNIDIV